MPFNPDHHRRSIRLSHYNYAQEGMYFLTICTAGRVPLFGKIVDQAVDLSDEGRIVAEEWQRTVTLRPYVILDSFVVMPDHFHGIVCITQQQADAHGQSEGLFPTRVAHTLGAIVRGFKAAVSRRIGYSVWQRNYYETIIRTPQHLHNVRQYITNNPRRTHDQFEP